MSRQATYQDVLDAPPLAIAEVVRGELKLSRRLSPPASHSASRLLWRLGSVFDREPSASDGWVMLRMPELHLAEDVIVPDVAGWRRTRMPEMPEAAFFTLAPDWVCEVLSPSTETIDRGDKVPLYATQGISHAWLLSPASRVLEVLELDGRTYRIVSTFKNDERARAKPFDSIELDLAALWAR